MYWDKLWKAVGADYYLALPMFIAAVTVIVYGLRLCNKRAENWLMLHAATTVVQTMIWVISFKKNIWSNSVLWWKSIAHSQYASIILEMTACTVYVLSATAARWAKKTILLCTLPVFIFVLWNILLDPFSKNKLLYSFSAENICLTISCLLYFISLLKEPAKKMLSKTPAFWAICGMLLLFSITAPLYLLSQMLSYNYAANNLFFINYIFYTILYLTYLKALQCSQKQPM